MWDLDLWNSVYAFGRMSLFEFWETMVRIEEEDIFG